MKKITRINEKALTIKRSESGESRIEGYAAKWNSDSTLLSERGMKFIERIAPMAFTPALENLTTSAFDCVATYDHQRSTLLARTRSGTLELSQDNIGLFFSFSTPDNTLARDISEKIERGDLDACSFIASYNPDFVQEERIDGNIYRTIGEFTSIRDIAIVVDAAYPATEVAEVQRSVTEFEEKENISLTAHRTAVDEQTAKIDKLLNLKKK